MVTLAFQGREIDVTSVGNGEAAVRRIPDLNPDLVLADIFMPVRNGYELCEWIKKDSKFSHIPVILLVGAFDPLDEKEARRVGADGVLKKPFIPPDPLIAMVVSALEKPKIAAELNQPKESAASQQPAAVQPPKPPLAPLVSLVRSRCIGGRDAREDYAKTTAELSRPHAGGGRTCICIRNRPARVGRFS